MPRPDAMVTADNPVRWGVLSAAAIARNKVLPAMVSSPLLRVQAVAARDRGRAEALAERFDIPVVHDSYQALLRDPRIEAVYLPLPNHLHLALTLEAAQAGKAVLCEKPMGLSAAALRELRPLARTVLLREAFMVEYQQAWLHARQLLRDGAIGTLRSGHLSFAYANADPHNIRNRADLGGGALYDIGCYGVRAARWFFDAEPLRVAAMSEHDPQHGVDLQTSGLLDFGAGRHFSFTVSMRRAREQTLTLLGSAGTLVLPLPINPPPDRPARLLLLGDAGRQDIVLPPHDQYRAQAESFGQRIRGGGPEPAALEQAIAQASAIDALRASARSGRFERPADF